MCMHELDCAWSLPVLAIKALERTAGGGGILNDEFELVFYMNTIDSAIRNWFMRKREDGLCARENKNAKILRAKG